MSGLPEATASRAPLAAVYADESCIGNGREGANPGGAGALVEILHPERGTLVRRDVYLSEPATTNNRMALRSAIQTLRALSAEGESFRIVFVSDSNYLIEGMKSWVHKWIKKNWRKADGRPVENLALWQEALEAWAPHEVEWRWLRGHAEHPQNEYADHLANTAARGLRASKGLEESSFDQWLGAQRARGRMTAVPDPFPVVTGFRGVRSPVMHLPGIR